MTRNKVLLALAAVGVVAAATAAPTVVSSLGSADSAAATTGTTSTPSSKCQYPPSRKPTLMLKASATTVKRNTTVRFSGTLTGNNCPIAGATVALYSSATQSGTYTATGQTAVTDAYGNYSFTRVVTTTTYYKTVFAGNAQYDATESNIDKVNVN